MSLLPWPLVETQPATVESVRTVLSAFSRDAAADRVETQAFLETPGGRLFTTLVEPAGACRDVGFVFCHSFAWEQYELAPLELRAARVLASEGFPSMTVQCRGFNDAGGDASAVTPASMLTDVLAAAAEVRVRTGVGAVVPVGVSFGSTTALLAALELHAPGVVLWNPVGAAAFLDGLLRASTVAGLLEDESEGEAAAPTDRRGFRELKAAVDGGETLDLFGFPVTTAFAAGCASIDLAAALAAAPAVPGQVQLVVINPASKRAAERISEAATVAGSTVITDVAEGPGRREFAASLPKGGHLVTHAALFDDIIARTVRWAKASM